MRSLVYGSFEGKGSMLAAIGRGPVGPKRMAEAIFESQTGERMLLTLIDFGWVY